MISFDDFLKVDIRVGKIVAVEDFPEARNPSYKLKIDFGKEIGTKASGAQITQYKKEELAGKLVLAVVNFSANPLFPLNNRIPLIYDEWVLCDQKPHDSWNSERQKSCHRSLTGGF